jgi:hypothetical protein
MTRMRLINFSSMIRSNKMRWPGTIFIFFAAQARAKAWVNAVC